MAVLVWVGRWWWRQERPWSEYDICHSHGGCEWLYWNTKWCYHIIGGRSEMSSYTYCWTNLILWLNWIHLIFYLTWLTQREWKRSSRDSKFIFPCKFYLQYSTGWLTETLITSFLNNPIFQPSQYPVSTFIFTFQQLNKPLTFTILSSQNNSQQVNILWNGQSVCWDLDL